MASNNSPAEKAKELVDKYYQTCVCTIAGTAHIFRDIAKSCALICVDEILETDPVKYGEEYFITY